MSCFGVFHQFERLKWNILVKNNPVEVISENTSIAAHEFVKGWRRVVKLNLAVSSDLYYRAVQPPTKVLSSLLSFTDIWIQHSQLRCIFLATHTTWDVGELEWGCVGDWRVTGIWSREAGKALEATWLLLATRPVGHTYQECTWYTAEVSKL